METSSNNSVHFAQQFLEDQRNDFNFNNSAAADSDKIANSHGLKESEAYANIFSTNLDDLMESTDDNTIDEETEEMITEAMVLPPEQRERRLKEIDQHVRFLKGQEKRKKILTEKNHRPFDDSNIGLCSVCMDDNFQIVHPVGSDTACDACFRKMREVQ